jgi:ABC-type uncharacterized transport system permease subunit
MLQPLFWSVVLAGAIRLATPIAFAAIGETIVERSGVLNLGIEGMMLVGALAGIAGAHYVSPWVGVLAGGLAGALCASLMAFAVLRRGANQVVVGISMSLLGLGLSTYIYQIWQPSGRSSVVAPLVPTLNVQQLTALPLIGEPLFHQSILTYICVALVPLTLWVLRDTRFGLAIRAAGDDPSVAVLRGVDVLGTRFRALLIGGALGGVGGASITVGYLGSFTDGVTAGRGFIAIAVVIIGGWTPLGACAGALLFAFFDSLSLLAQTSGMNLPTEVYSALPYLVTFVVLVLTARRRRSPRALGKPLAV